MAQYSGEEVREQFENVNQERNERLSDSESHQKHQGEGYSGLPENVADTTKEGLSGPNPGTPVEEGRGYDSVDTNAQPSEGGSGAVNPEGYGDAPCKGHDDKISSDTSSNVLEDAGGFPGDVREFGEDRDRKSSGDDGFIGGEKSSTDSDFGSKIAPEFGGSNFQAGSDRLEPGNEENEGGYENLRPDSGDASQLGYQVLGKSIEDGDRDSVKNNDAVYMTGEKPAGELPRSDYDESGSGASEERVWKPFANAESGRKEEGGTEGLAETSPYTQHDGGEGYTTNTNSDASVGFGVAGPDGPTIAAGAGDEGQAKGYEYDDLTRTPQESQYGNEERSKKEEVKEKIVPEHKTEADEKEECVDSPKPKEGFMEKIKEKLTGKHGDTVSTNDDQEHVGVEQEAPKKKGMFEKIKEKLSSSSI